MGFELLGAGTETETEAVAQVMIIPVFAAAIPFQIQIQSFQGWFHDVVLVKFIAFVLEIEIEIYFMFLFGTPRLFQADSEARIIDFMARAQQFFMK